MEKRARDFYLNEHYCKFVSVVSHEWVARVLTMLDVILFFTELVCQMILADQF